MLSAVQITRSLNQAFLQKKEMKQLHYLHVDANSQKLKVVGKIFGRKKMKT